MDRGRRAIAAAFAALAWAAAAADRPPVDPDSPETQRRAVAALEHAERRTIAGETREIVGIARGVDALLKDLNAQVRGREVKIALSADVLFDFDKDVLKREAAPELQKVAEVLKQYPKGSARIEGHADGKGNAAYNQKLSERRAQTVRRWLATHGVAMKLAARGWGKTKPIAPNSFPDGRDNPEGRAKNRRVEISFER